MARHAQLTIHSGNTTLQLWRSEHYQDKYELMIGSGGDWPEEQIIILSAEQLNQIELWTETERHND